MPLPIQRFAYYSFVVFFLIYACAQTPENKIPATPAFSLKDLETAILAVSKEVAIKQGQLAFSVKSTQTGKILYEYNAQKSVIIASNMKLVTTAAAMAILGEDFTFKTELQHDGMLEANGILKGNLYITGGGDPCLGSARVKEGLDTKTLMELWAQKISAYGIRQIQGGIIADAELFNDNVMPSGWTWGDTGNYYGAPAYGLNLNDNLYTLYFKPGTAVGDPTRILRTEPAMKDIEFVNEVTTGKPGSGDNAYIYGAPYTQLRYIQGTVPAGVSEFDIQGSLPDPALLCANLLHQKLVQQGITISNVATSTRLMKMRKYKINQDRKPIYTHLSSPLSAIVEQTNLKSMNLYAEAMTKALGVKQFTDGTTVSGTEAIVAFWKEQGITMDGFFMRDGSGLSRTNVISATTLTDILNWSAKAPIFNALYQSLPVAGVSGTMKNMAKGTAAAGNVRAKTGSLERVMSYSGYFRTKSGELMSFTMVANDYAGENGAMRKKMERLMVLMAEIP